MTAKTGFWKRQFLSSSVSPQQTTFDVLFGVVAPLLCLWFDPIVFNDRGFLEMWRLPVILAIGIEIVALSFFLGVRRGNVILVGILGAGAILALTIGLVLLPLSIIGILVFVGIFGFTPLFTAVVYARNAYRCWVSVGSVRGFYLAPALLGVVLALAASFGAQLIAQRLTQEAIQTLKSGPDEGYAEAVRTLRYMRH